MSWRNLRTASGGLGDLIADVPTWYERALCPQIDGDLFFPDKGQSPRAAKRMCARCEVKTECLQYALDRGETHGVWGGLSEPERKRMRRAVRQSGTAVAA